MLWEKCLVGEEEEEEEKEVGGGMQTENINYRDNNYSVGKCDK